jgi:hypothetical protein
MIDEMYSKVKDAQAYKDWSENHKDGYLAHVFVMLSKPDENVDWQFGFYTESDDLLTPFTLKSDGSVVSVPPDKIFKEPGSKVEELDISKAKLSLTEAMEKAAQTKEEKFPAILTDKNICILQHREGKTMWNVTLIGPHATTVNIKMDAESGELIHAEQINLFEKMQS